MELLGPIIYSQNTTIVNIWRIYVTSVLTIPGFSSSPFPPFSYLSLLSLTNTIATITSCLALALPLCLLPLPLLLLLLLLVFSIPCLAAAASGLWPIGMALVLCGPAQKILVSINCLACASNVMPMSIVTSTKWEIVAFTLKLISDLSLIGYNISMP